MMKIRPAVITAGVVLCCSCSSHSDLRDDSRVDELLARMTLDEKISLLHGAPESPATDQGEAGYLPGIARLGIPALRFADGPPGVLTRDAASGLPATMALAATFSRDDARANGVVIGRDAQARGVDIVLEPYINIHRDQTFARAYNTYGEDPLLSGAIGAALIDGIQGQGIMAMAKHYIAYDGASDVSVDSQALHEIYLPPFAAAVAANVASIMCSYNLVNGAYACGNEQLLSSVLRGELGFQGFVSSDWGAVHGTPFINAGLDLEMPGSGTVMHSFFQALPPNPGQPRRPLAPPMVNQIPEEPPPPATTAPSAPGTPAIGMIRAVQNGSVSVATITRSARRILRQMRRFGLLDRPSSINAATAGRESEPSVEANAAILRRTAEDAAVLIKNGQGALPLSNEDLGSLAMIGPGALQDVAVGESGEKALGRVERQIGPSVALQAAVGGAARIVEAAADDMTGVPIPGADLSHDGGAGLIREDSTGKGIGVDPQIDFTRERNTALPTGTSQQWSGRLHVPSTGRYRLNLQVLGASATLAIDGQRVAATGPLQLHGDVLQPGQDNVLPTRDGLDNVRKQLDLRGGPHALSVQVNGDTSGQPVQVRLAWTTPEQRSADYEQAINAARMARKVVLFAWSRGRPSFQLPGDQDQLIADVAAVNPNTVVVLNISEPIAMPWLDKVKAVLLMWYPGDEGGRASADVLLGRVSPAGRLPFTWPKSLQQSVANDPAHPERSCAGIDGKTTYSEGIFVGYRWFDEQQLDPLYPFGYGLSYTRFDYADLSVERAADGGLDVQFELHNAGSQAGDEVPQLYLGPPQPPPAGAQFAPRALAAFDRVHLGPGESRTVQLHAAPRALQYWSSTQGQWLTATGARNVYVGASSRDPRLQATTTVAPR